MHENQKSDVTTLEIDEDALWRAVQNRDSRYDGVFVYGVGSTRIYCRPACPARRPRREQVRFFAAPANAQSAGFRACQRCHPATLNYATREVERVAQACRQIEQNAAGEVSLGKVSLHTLSQGAKRSPHHFHRTFKQVTGVTPRQYGDAARLAQLKDHLQAGETVTQALYDAGYGSSRGLYERAAAQLGMTPASYRKGGQGAVIHYAIAACSLGYLLVATTDKGICAVSLGDDPSALTTGLRQEFHAATLQLDNSRLQANVQAILEYLTGQQPHLDLPLDVQATAFQRRVWQELQAIPYGQTRTYTQIAEAIGQPTAARAVARACATNSVALVIPCHRVVRENGSLSGYRWGVARKQKLLQTECSTKK
ncbi:MAG: bifunctional DNA-binding transcriptional regulator/O6-methylguanine-DNA methyltransferase Ada [Abitibacteriaceae bacterium]|nr:bifunctional DNA-binding transcriptional regulator/O6-methylguanine-DNA methyltransferase Ada [Abditibacteriaceae bacterium]